MIVAAQQRRSVAIAYDIVYFGVALNFLAEQARRHHGAQHVGGRALLRVER